MVATPAVQSDRAVWAKPWEADARRTIRTRDILQEVMLMGALILRGRLYKQGAGDVRKWQAVLVAVR